MIRLLEAFEPYKDLLHEQDGFQAKTGTLTGVNTLAGYLNSPRYGPVRFAILVNRNVPTMYKFEVAKALRARLQ
jgi:D-alanyl-D-alanine carboxypeptidase/D-alanyl-D-alanine-endopeptidase (penicillin-binding protein 4)